MNITRTAFAALSLALLLASVATADDTSTQTDADRVNFQWNTQIPMRDDPHDLKLAALQAASDPSDLTDQSPVYAGRGKLLVYHTAPFEQDTEVSGFFRLSAWLAIDRPDTDFSVSLYEIRQDGSSIVLTHDLKRARYRESAREEKLIATSKPLQYDFDHFTFTSRLIKKGSRLRLVIAPINSIYSQKNYNSGGDVSAESMKDARTVTVTLYHDRTHPSTLFVPMGQKD